MENKRFGLENEAKMRPRTNISVDVAKKREKNRKCTHTSGTGGVADLEAPHRTEKQFRKRRGHESDNIGHERVAMGGLGGYILIRSKDGGPLGGLGGARGQGIAQV